MDDEIRSYKGPPSLAITEHWNYEDRGKDFFGGYSYMSQGPLPQLWANTQMSAHGLWGSRLIEAMKNYNHVVGLKIVGEMLPQESNRVTLADETDQYGLRIPRITYSWCDNDKRLIDHALKFMHRALQAVERQRHLDAGRRYLSPQRHRANGRRSSDQRRRCGLPKLGHSQPVDMRRLGVSDRRRRQSVAHDPGDRVPDRRPYSRACPKGRTDVEAFGARAQARVGLKESE